MWSVNDTKKLAVTRFLSGSISSLFVNRFELFLFWNSFSPSLKIESFIGLIFSWLIAESFNLCTVNILSWTVLCCGGSPRHCRTLKASLASTYWMTVASPPHPVVTKLSSDLAKCTCLLGVAVGAASLTAETHWWLQSYCISGVWIGSWFFSFNSPWKAFEMKI